MDYFLTAGGLAVLQLAATVTAGPHGETHSVYGNLVDRNVKHWPNAEMALRWTAADIIEAQCERLRPTAALDPSLWRDTLFNQRWLHRLFEQR